MPAMKRKPQFKKTVLSESGKEAAVALLGTDGFFGETRGVSSDICIDMSEQDSLDRVWDIIEKVGVCMLTTQFAGGLRARPLEARPDRNAGVIWFVTDKRSSKEHEIEAEHDVALVLHPFARSLGPCSIPAFLRSAFSP